MITGAAGQTLTDVLGAESDPVYRAGQALAVLESWQLRLPRLRIMVVGGLTPRVVALVGTSVRSAGSAIATSSDVRHVLHLKSLMQRELGTEPLDIAGYAHTGQLFEIRPSAVADLRRATWTLAEAADEVVAAFSALQAAQGALGMLTRPRLRTRVTEAQARWTRECDALVRVGSQLPVLPVSALPVGATRMAAVWDEHKRVVG